jgi:hypothetical protein
MPAEELEICLGRRDGVGLAQEAVAFFREDEKVSAALWAYEA